MDGTLREITDLVKEVNSAAAKPNSCVHFSIVYPDKNGKNVMKEIGAVSAQKKSENDRKTLRELRFQAGDFLDISIT